MIAGNVKDENQKVISALRTINSEIGYIIKDGKVLLIGKEIADTLKVLKAISKIRNIEIVNEHGTAAILELKSQDPVYVQDMDEKGGEVICAIA